MRATASVLSESARSQTYPVLGQAHPLPPALYVRPTAFDELLAGAHWVVLGHEGSGKTELLAQLKHELNDCSRALPTVASEMQEVLSIDRVYDLLGASRQAAKNRPKLAASIWKLLIAAQLLGTLRKCPPRVRLWRLFFKVHGILPGSRWFAAARLPLQLVYRAKIIVKTPFGKVEAGPAGGARVRALDALALDLPIDRLWDNIAAHFADPAQERIFLLLDDLEDYGPSALEESTLPGGALEVLCDIKERFVRASSSGHSSPVNCLAFISSNLFNASDHVKDVLSPLDLVWELDQLRSIVAAHFTAGDLQYCTSASDRRILLTPLEPRPFPYAPLDGGDSHEDYFDYALSELRTASGAITPKDALRFFASLNHLPLVARSSLDDVQKALGRPNKHKRSTAEHKVEAPAAQYIVPLHCHRTRGERHSLSDIVHEWLNTEDAGRQLFIILGDYGTGKTTFACDLFKKLVVWNRTFPSNTRIPVFFDLRQVRLSDSIDAFFKEVCGKHDLPCSDRDSFCAFASSSRVLAIMDGFDEMTLRPSENDVCDNVKKVREVVNVARTILLSRTHLFSGRQEISRHADNLRSDFPVTVAATLLRPLPDDTVVLSSFDQCDINRVIELFSQAEAARVREWIDSTYNLSELAQTPLFLHMILSAVRSHIPQPRGSVTSAKVYEMYTQDWLSRQYAHIPEAIRDVGLEPFLAGIAFFLYRNNRGELSFEEFDRAFSWYIESGGRLAHDVFMKAIAGKDKHTSGPEFWRQLSGCTFLIVDAPPTGRLQNRAFLRFSHDSFREYFAARYIFQSIEQDNWEIQDGGRYGEDYWTLHVDTFLCGLLGEERIESIIGSALLSQKCSLGVRMNAATTIGRWPNKQRAVDFLLEAYKREKDIGVAGRIAESLYRQGQEDKFWHFLGHLTEYKGCAPDTGKSLGQKLLYDIEDDWTDTPPKGIAEHLTRQLKSPEPRIQKYSVYMIGRLGCKECLSDLVALLGTRPGTRFELYLIGALGRIGDASTLNILRDFAANAAPECERHLAAAIGRLEALA